MTKYTTCHIMLLLQHCSVLCCAVLCCTVLCCAVPVRLNVAVPLPHSCCTSNISRRPALHKFANVTATVQFVTAFLLYQLLLAGFLPVVSQLFTRFLPVVCKLLISCLPGVSQLFTGCLPVVSQLFASFFTRCLPVAYQLLPIFYQVFASCLPALASFYQFL